MPPRPTHPKYPDPRYSDPRSNPARPGSYRPSPDPHQPRPQSLPPRSDPRPYRPADTEWRTFDALPALRPGIPETETAPATELETPTFRPASWRKRLGAFAVDFGLGLGAAYLAQGVAGLVGSGSAAVDMAGYGAFFAAWLVNRGYLQSRPQGQSLGKWLFNLKTIDTETETSPSVVRSVAREGVVSLFVLTEALLVPLGADALFALFDPEKRQALHDKAGRTQVVESDQGYQLDEKAAQLLADLMESDSAQEIQDTLDRWIKQAKRNPTVANLSDQAGRFKRDLSQNTRSLRPKKEYPPPNWVDRDRKP